VAGSASKKQKSWKARIRNKMAPLKAKERKGTLSPAEAKLLADLRRQTARGGPYAAQAGGRKRERGPVEVYGPGVRSVVSGGAPSLGKRR